MSGFNLEHGGDYHVNAKALGLDAPEKIERSTGWYLIPTKYDSNDKPVAFRWHLGQRWCVPSTDSTPPRYRGAPVVIEFCQGDGAFTGKGAGAPHWHGPEGAPTDWPNAAVCTRCVKIEELMHALNENQGALDE